MEDNNNHNDNNNNSNDTAASPPPRRMLSAFDKLNDNATTTTTTSKRHLPIRARYLPVVVVLVVLLNLTYRREFQWIFELDIARALDGDKHENITLSNSNATGTISERTLLHNNSHNHSHDHTHSRGHVNNNYTQSTTEAATEEAPITASPTQASTAPPSTLILHNYSHLDQGAFLHLGKTGGSTLSNMMMNACHSWVRKPCRPATENETIVSLKTTHYYHVPDFPKLATLPKLHSYYIITLRDPYDRTKSAFVYGHPANMHALGTARGERGWQKLLRQHNKSMPLLTKCFLTLEDFVQNLGNGQDVMQYNYPYNHQDYALHQESCQDFARAALMANVKPMQHLYMNLDHVWRSLEPHNGFRNVTVLFATRQDHLMEDFNSINQLLAAEPQSRIEGPEKKMRDVSGVELPVPNSLSEAGRQTLCQALRLEYQRYIGFLKMAVNLTPQDVENALAKSRQNCGDQLEFL